MDTRSFSVDVNDTIFNFVGSDEDAQHVEVWHVFQHSMVWAMECSHSTVQPLKVYIPWKKTIECVHSTEKVWNVHIPRFNH